MRQFFFAVMMSAVVFVPSEARSQASEPEAAAPVPKHAAAFERAYRLKEQGKEAQALAAFNAILAKDPNNQIATTEAGYLHASLKHYGAAVKLLAAASAQDPQNMQLHMDLGYAYQAMKRHELAQERFRLVASKPGELQAAAQTAATDAGLAMAGEAQAEAGRRQQLMDRGYNALNRGDKAAARKAFAAVVAKDPKDEAALKQLGFIDFERGDLESAAAGFEAVRALRPADHQAALQLGYTYDRLKKKEKARAAFTTALESSDAEIHDAAQTALQASGEPEASAPAAPL